MSSESSLVDFWSELWDSVPTFGGFMKKLVLLISLLATSSAMANDAAAVIGGMILGAIITESAHTPPPPPPPPIRPSHNGDYIFRSSEPPVVVYQDPRPVYKFVDIYIPECRCYRSVMVQIN